PSGRRPPARFHRPKPGWAISSSASCHAPSLSQRLAWPVARGACAAAPARMCSDPGAPIGLSWPAKHRTLTTTHSGSEGQSMRYRISLLGLAAAGVLTASTSASAQTVTNGPYYASPSWDQTLACSALANCPRFVVLANMNNDAVLDRETGLVWE